MRKKRTMGTVMTMMIGREGMKRLTKMTNLIVIFSRERKVPRSTRGTSNEFFSHVHATL